jgi:hypothetical protein
MRATGSSSSSSPRASRSARRASRAACARARAAAGPRARALLPCRCAAQRPACPWTQSAHSSWEWQRRPVLTCARLLAARYAAAAVLLPTELALPEAPQGAL